MLFNAGDVADGAYAVQQGSFTLRPERGAEADIIAGPGTLLGESALLAETIRPATATAREPSTVLRISRAMFLKMLEGYPDAAHRLARSDRRPRRSVGAGDGECPRRARAAHQAEVEAAVHSARLALDCRRCSSSRLTSRASSVAGNSWPMTDSRLARLRANGCTGVMSPKPAVVSVVKLK